MHSAPRWGTTDRAVTAVTPSRCALGLLVALMMGAATSARAQLLYFSNHREVAIPKYATLRIGPFYSTALFTQTAGYTYTRSSGEGVDYLISNRRGTILKDGSELPLVSTLNLRNYLLITRQMDVDLSVQISYAQYPLGTQDDTLYVDAAGEGVIGDLSTEIILTPYLKATLYDHFVYHTDYVDVRGRLDPYGGQEYTYIRNTVGAYADWLMARDKSLDLAASWTVEIPQSKDFRSQDRSTFDESATYEQEILPGFIAGARAGYEQTHYEVDDRLDTHIQDYSIYGKVDRTGGMRMRLTEASILRFGVGYSLGYAYAKEQVQENQSDFAQEQAADVSEFTGFVNLETQLRKDLKHKLGYSHVLRGGFSSAFEVVDAYDYVLSWEGVVSSLSLFTRVEDVQPSDEFYPEYRDWASGLNASYLIAQPITLLLTVQYDDRQNKPSDSRVNLDDEFLYNYATWYARLGTSFAVTRSIDFLTYVEHIERTSASQNLDYNRDQFGAIFKYTHQF